jgi:hypothetical protein
VVTIEAGLRVPQRFFETAQLIVLVGAQGHWDDSTPGAAAAA